MGGLRIRIAGFAQSVGVAVNHQHVSVTIKGAAIGLLAFNRCALVKACAKVVVQAACKAYAGNQCVRIGVYGGARDTSFLGAERGPDLAVRCAAHGYCVQCEQVVCRIKRIHSVGVKRCTQRHHSNGRSRTHQRSVFCLHAVCYIWTAWHIFAFERQFMQRRRAHFCNRWCHAIPCIHLCNSDGS